jgi:hypothetical protein
MTNTTQTPVRVRWSNGHVDSAPDWQELLDKVRLSQWHAWDEDEFRQVLGKRAIRWSGTFIDSLADPETLFVELERARLVEILNPNDDDREEQ